MARRQSVWLQAFATSAVLTGVTFVSNLTLQFILTEGLGSLRGYTLVRTIGEIAIRPVVPSSSGVLDFATAFLNVGGNAAPAVAPQSQSADYTWWYGGSAGLDGSEVAAGSFGATTRYLRVDSRAQRKTSQQEQNYFWIFQNASTATLTVFMSVRCLYKLP